MTPESLADAGRKPASVEAVFVEGVLERLAPTEALDFLAAAHRALEEGGALRLATPNLDWVWKHQYHLAPGDDRAHLALGLNRAFHGWRHRFLWNRELLARALSACGFDDLAWRMVGQSPRALFRGLERGPAAPDEAEVPHTLIVEAVRGTPRAAQLSATRASFQMEYAVHLGG